MIVTGLSSGFRIIVTDFESGKTCRAIARSVFDVGGFWLDL